MMIIKSTFLTIVKLDVGAFIYFYDFLNNLLFNTIKNQANSFNFFKDEEGKEYYTPNIRTIFFSFKEIYDENINAIEDWKKYTQMGGLDQLEKFDAREYKTFEIEMDFQYWNLLFDVTEYFKNSDSVENQYEDNDWSPPDHFRDGTDDEKEIWESYGKS